VSGRSPYLASGIGHLVVLAGLLTLSMLQRSQVFVPGVRIVAFPGGGGGHTKAAPEPEPKAETPEPPPPKPVEPVKKPEAKSPLERKHEAPPQPNGVRPARKEEIVSKSAGRPKDVAPTPPVQATGPAASAATGTRPGAGAGSGGVGFEAEGDIGPLSGYLSLLRDKVAMSWRPPPGVGRTGLVTAVVYFRIPPGGGQPLDVAIASGSGSSFFDREALSAVVSAAPLQPLPGTWSGGTIGIKFTFHQEY
jgi:TonB family protein